MRAPRRGQRRGLCPTLCGAGDGLRRSRAGWAPWVTAHAGWRRHPARRPAATRRQRPLAAPRTMTPRGLPASRFRRPPIRRAGQRGGHRLAAAAGRGPDGGWSVEEGSPGRERASGLSRARAGGEPHPAGGGRPWAGRAVRGWGTNRPPASLRSRGAGLIDGAPDRFGWPVVAYCDKACAPRRDARAPTAPADRAAPGAARRGGAPARDRPWGKAMGEPRRRTRRERVCPTALLPDA